MQRRRRQPGLPARKEVEDIIVRTTARQAALSKLVQDGQKDIDAAAQYFERVNAVYARSHDSYANVLSKVRLAAQSRQEIINLLYGFGAAVAVSAFAELMVPAEALAGTIELIGMTYRTAVLNVVPNAASATASTYGTPQAAGQQLTTLSSLDPSVLQLRSVRHLLALQRQLLSLAGLGLQAFYPIATAAERIVGELRVADAGGDREMSDRQLEAAVAGLRRVDSHGAALDHQVRDADAGFAAVRQEVASRYLPTTKRTEQDIWIRWLPSQNSTEINNDVLIKYLVRVGVAERVGAHFEGAFYNAFMTPHVYLPRQAEEHGADIEAYWRLVFLERS